MVYWRCRMALSWDELGGTSHYQEGPCDCPARHAAPSLQHDFAALHDVGNRALGKSLAHNVGTRCGQRARRSALRNSSQCAEGQGDSENTEIVIVHLIAKASIAGLVKSFELVEAQGITIRHDEAVEENGQTCLAEGVHFLCFA